MKTQKKENKTWTLLAPIVVLVSICLVITAALAATNMVTKPIIDGQQQAARDRSMQLVLPEGSGFTLIEGLTGLPENVLPEIYEAGNGAGYVIFITGKGFGGDMSVIAGITADGKIAGTRVLVHNESAGIGTKVVDDGSDYQTKLIGMGDTSGIEAVSGATVSSNGMKAAVQSAFDAYTIITGGTVEAKLSTKPATLTDKAIEKFFPGASLTEVEGGQVSDAGTIVYGEAQGMESVVHVAVFFDNDKNIVGVVADTLSETEYIGDVVGANEDFMGSFVGAADVGSIEAVSGATITSTAVKDAVKQAVGNYDTVKGAA